MIIVAMPIIEGEHIHQRVLDGIRSQKNCELNLIVSHQIPLLGIDREKNINNNRHQLQSMIDSKPKYVLLLDSDVVLDDPSTVACMSKYLDEHPSIGCVAIDTKHISLDLKHVICACALIRNDIYQKIDFAISSQCQCFIVRGYCQSVYLPEKINAHEI